MLSLLPKLNDNFCSTKIPVNNAYVTQCNWGNIRLDHSLTIARPYGWVFGIPLQNRVSIGYLFNDKFNTVEDIKEDVKYIFERFNLTPTDKTNHIKFSNYYRKENFTNKMAYAGNNHDDDKEEIQSQEKDDNEDISLPTNLFHSINENYPKITKFFILVKMEMLHMNA